MKKYLFLLATLFVFVLTSCDKSDPDPRDAFVGSYAVNALFDYAASVQDHQESGSFPLNGKCSISKDGDGNGVLITGDVYCNATITDGKLQIENQQFHQMTLQGLIDLNVTFEPAQLVDNIIKINGKASGSATVSGQKSTLDGTITAVATKQ